VQTRAIATSVNRQLSTLNARKTADHGLKLNTGGEHQSGRTPSPPALDRIGNLIGLTGHEGEHSLAELHKVLLSPVSFA
jgi:hypothetical protein